MVASSASQIKWTPASGRKPCTLCGAKKRCQVADNGTQMCYGGPFDGARGPIQGELGEYWIGGGSAAEGGFQAATVSAPAPRRQLTPPQLHIRYLTLLSHLGLSPKHRNVLEEKGLNETAVAFMAIKTLGKERQHAAQRVADLYPDWRDIPGLYEDERGRPNLAGSPGYLIPCWDPEGNIIALQIRKDNDSDSKCEWFSSSHKDGGLGPGGQFSFFGYKKGTNRIRITEGGPKAYLAYLHTGVATISAPGISFFGSDRLIDLLLELSILVVVLAPDADFREKPEVLEAVRRAITRFQAAGFQVEVEAWDPSTKGIDDCLLAGHEIQTVTPEAFLRLASGNKPDLVVIEDPGSLQWSREEPSGLEKQSVWDDPEPIDALPPGPEFPLDCFTDKVAAFVAGRTEELQTPTDLQALTLLGATSVPLLGAVKVNPFGSWVEPLNLLCAPIAPPGEKKSATVRAIFAPHDKEEARITGVFEAEKRRRRAARRMLELEMRDAKKDGDTDRISALHEKIEELEPPTRPQLILDDSTDEARALAMSQNKGRIGLASAEGTLFSGVARYSADGAPRVDTLLKGHAGDALRINRVGREPIFVSEAHIGGTIMAQPDVIKRLTKHEDLKGVGFLARWFWSYPDSRMGRRNMAARPCPESCYTDWELTCMRLFSLGADVENPRFLRFGPQAVNRLREWMGEIEPMLAGELAFMADWAAKLAGLTVRLAGILHCLNHASTRAETFTELIGPPTLEQAITLARYALSHARRAYFLMGYKGSQPTEGADLEILTKLASLEPGKRISVRDFHRRVDSQPRFKRKEALDLVLGALQSKGWIRILRLGTGGRPSDHIDLHPRFQELISPIIQGQKGQ